MLTATPQHAPARLSLPPFAGIQQPCCHHAPLTLSGFDCLLFVGDAMLTVTRLSVATVAATFGVLLLVLFSVVLSLVLAVAAPNFQPLGLSGVADTGSASH